MPRLLRALVALGVPVATLLGPLAALPAAGAEPRAAVTTSAHDGVTVELVSSTPTVAGPGDTVRVTVRVTNEGPEPVEDLDVDLGAGWRPVTSREALARWADEESNRTAGTRQATETVEAVPPGGSADVTLEMDVDADLQLRSDAPWGPRQMSVAVRDAEGTADVLHTFFLFDPVDGTGPASPPAEIRLSVLAPVTGPPLDPADPEAYAAGVDVLTAPGGGLAGTLDLAVPDGGGPAVSLAVDPAVVATAASSDDTETLAWADAISGTGTSAGPAPDVVTLPALDPDLGALAHAGLSDDGIAAAANPELGVGGWEPPSAWSTSLAWPVGAPDVETLGAARAAGADHVLVPDGLETRGGTAATALARVETPRGPVSAVVADPSLSTALAAAATRGAGPTLADARRLLADTAVLANQAAARVLAQGGPDGEPVHVVAAMPRDWAPDPAAMRSLLEELEASGWVDVVPFTDLLDRPAPRVEGEPLPGSEPDAAELDPATVRRLADARAAVDAYASVAAEPATLAGGIDAALTAPLAVAYRSAPDARGTAVESALARADELRAGLSVVPRGTPTLISDTGDLPVRVRNDLPVDATVTVVLRPDDPRLVVEDRPTVVVPAESAVDVPVRVRAIGSGDVGIRVEVLAPSGTPVLQPTSFEVRVRAGWETVGTAVVAAAIGLLFVGGIWRTVRRGRSARRTTGERVAPAPTEAPATAPTPVVPPRQSQPEDHTA
ncbi:DUF6049 family protein [Isoptericola variabilis]|uniref:DUF6049 family protein n=1 Tax=Isoptericola variabilis TaxID=139208 RepID=UPI001640B419|nr:DUF6049 family protein [Isoptericola variabilis]